MERTEVLDDPPVNGLESPALPPKLRRKHPDLVGAEATELVKIAARDVTADRVHMHMSAAARIRGSIVEAAQCAVGQIQANEVRLTRGGVGAVLAESARVEGPAGLIAADRVEFGTAYAGVLAGHHIRGNRINTVVLIGNRLDGEVSAVLDTRQALLAGLVGGLFAGLILALTRGVLRRD